MLNRYLKEQSGITLIELLITLALFTMIIGIAFGVLTTTSKHNDKTQSHIDLRQEANIIITQLRQKHQAEIANYSVCVDELFISNHITVSEMLLKEAHVLDQACTENLIDPYEHLPVQFTIENKDYHFSVDTIIEGKQKEMYSEPIVIDIPDSGSEEDTFYTIVRNDNVFVYGSQLIFSGGDVEGPNATMIIRGNLETNQLNGGAFSNVSHIFIDGSAQLDGGSASLGSLTHPGDIIINGNLGLWSGSRNVYGDVYVNGNFRLKDARIFGNVYVNGDVELGWTPTLSEHTRIYYTGSLQHPNNYNQNILSKVIHQSEVETKQIPDLGIPQLRADDWYRNKGYDQTIRENNMKIFANNVNIQSYYDDQLGRHISTFTDAIIVSQGDITIGNNQWVNKMTGVLFAPNGKVTFHGTHFEGLVIARDGFHVTSGGTKVIFKNIDEYIENEADFPLGSSTN
ncbi:PulJ/GspJ family protein [Halalkalibacter okhensis]|uniref:Prepilin-type N-terminal cleavage/methylation domain-containing protein n=1 Tax=Halalkalibacter okhensis TaxID=333138 RepID=A0A0B0IJB1_9BACI|nr:prepilin-type N-terminal cleavage/methylation domain-containing protein [Halalkalibacter okhensis]KHF40957.1 hypothetical protein LQ50_06095 [Halalkalibacter okhensis]